MDRREALKKLAIGSGAAVGTTAILTSRAFAGTTPSTPAPSFTASIDMGNAVIAIEQAAASCSRSSTSSTTTGSAITTTTANMATVTTSPTTLAGSPLMGSVTVSPFMGGSFSNGDTITVQVTSSATCNYPAAPTMLSSTCTTTATATITVAGMTTSIAIGTTTAQMCA